MGFLQKAGDIVDAIAGAGDAIDAAGDVIEAASDVAADVLAACPPKLQAKETKTVSNTVSSSIS